MADGDLKGARYVGTKSLNSLVGRIKYENFKQDEVIEQKVNAEDELMRLDVINIWNSVHNN